MEPVPVPEEPAAPGDDPSPDRGDPGDRADEAARPDVGQIVHELLADERQAELKADVVHRVTLPAEAARRMAVTDVEPALPPEVVRGLAAGGIGELFSHQAEGWAATARGDNVLVTTPTASGKSLVFHLPPLVEAARGGPGKALYLFPLKALGQDQRAKFDQLADRCGLPPEVARAEIYDGDTPGAVRAKIKKDPPRVLVTNPDMLHMGVLGAWTGWAELLENLRWVVLDELHTYRGIFGSHFHHVLRRFLRLAREAGSNPTLIASSATAGNAREFAETLTGRRFVHVGESGAPRAERHMVLVDPWASPYTTALALFTRLLEAGLKTIVFTKARRVTELMVSWLRRQNPQLARRVRAYRSGFLPEERRSIEQRLFSGELDGVISTSALEMGIDVGGLDACILVGYPGSMMATWQRSGRAGRGARASLTALVALPDALDQYFLAHPDEFLERPCERLIVDPGNLPVSRAHLVCAAAELSLTAARDGGSQGQGVGGDGYLDRYGSLVESMVDDQVLVRSGDGSELYSFQRRPHGRVSLRGSGQSYEIVDGTTGELVGTIDGVRVLHECHPGAVYLHGGRQYLVETLDLDLRHVVASPADVEYFTTPLTEKETEILEVTASRSPSDELPLAAHLARVRVTERVVGFERKQIGSQELLSQQPLDELPPSVFETVGVLWVAPRAFEDQLRRSQEHWLGALHATEHAAISLVPLLALCDRGDVGGISYPRHPQVGAGAVFVYDGHPGGVGIAERVFEELPDLLGRVLALLDGCPCDGGCPSCVQSPKCGNGNRPLDKSGARRVLRLLLGEEEPDTVVEHPALTLDLDDDGRAALVPPERRARPAPLPAPAPEPEISESSAAPERPLVLMPTPAPAPADAGEAITVLFDIETRRGASEVGGWGNPHKMGLALAVALVLEEGRFEVFDESRVGELVALLERARLVVGYNSRRFDYGVLSGYTGVDYRRTLPTLDLLDDVRRASGARVGLDHLARETLGEGEGKSGDGLQCLEWVREGRLDLVESYCRRDVEVLRDVYLHGRREGFVRLRHRKKGPIDVPVDW